MGLVLFTFARKPQRSGVAPCARLLSNSSAEACRAAQSGHDETNHRTTFRLLETARIQSCKFDERHLVASCVVVGEKKHFGDSHRSRTL